MRGRLGTIDVACPNCGKKEQLLIHSSEVTAKDNGELSLELKASVYTHNCEEASSG